MDLEIFSELLAAQRHFNGRLKGGGASDTETEGRDDGGSNTG